MTLCDAVGRLFWGSAKMGLCIMDFFAGPPIFFFSKKKLKKKGGASLLYCVCLWVCVWGGGGIAVSAD